MSMKPETLFKMRVLRRLREIPDSWFEKIQQSTIHGTPDILGCIAGIFVALELKYGKGKTTALQQIKLRRIRAAGGFSAVLHEGNYDDIIRELEELRCWKKDLPDVGQAISRT